jgi:hypothetical protein
MSEDTSGPSVGDAIGSAVGNVIADVISDALDTTGASRPGSAYEAYVARKERDERQRKHEAFMTAAFHRRG